MHDHWLNFIARNIFKYKVESKALRDKTFDLNAQSRSVNGFTLARLSTFCAPSNLIRDNGDIGNDSQDRYVVYMSVRGELELTQQGRTQLYRPNTLAFIAGSDPILHSKLGNNDTVTLLMPRSFVDGRLVDAHSYCCQPIDTTRGLGQLASRTLAALQEDSAHMECLEFESAVSLVSDLVLLAVSGRPGLMSADRSARTANLARAKRIIRSQLGNPDLTITDIAERCGLSIGYLHALFRDDGITVWEYVRTERLQHARQLLASFAGQTVTDVALACGFSNLSHFSNAFKKAFNTSPRDVLARRR